MWSSRATGPFEFELLGNGLRADWSRQVQQIRDATTSRANGLFLQYLGLWEQPLGSDQAWAAA